MSEVYHEATQLSLFDEHEENISEFEMAPTKFCKGCSKEKSLDDFHRDKYSPDGYYTICKICKNARLPHSANPIKVTRSEEVRAKRRKREHAKKERLRLERQLNPPLPEPPKETKICPRCDPPTEKPISDFSMSKGRKDGHAGWCKECASVRRKTEEAKTRDREYRKIRRRDPVIGPSVRKGLNQWRREHPESQQELTLRRNARKKQATTECVNLQRILERDGYFCYICNKLIDPNAIPKSQGSLTFDHVIPLQPRLGDPQGTHSEDNIKPAHKVCNARKENKSLETLTSFDRSGVD